MFNSLFICLFFLVKFNLPIGIEALQTFKSGYFDVILNNKTLSTSSSNLIKSFQSDRTSCLLACNQMPLCNLFIYKTDGFCTLCRKGAINELVDTVSGEMSIVFESQNSISNMIMDGLVNYWPIVNDLNDYISTADLSPGQLNASETVGFTQDRFNNTNGSIYTNPGYYTLPPGYYFNSTYSFLVWVKVLAFNPYSRVIDCGNGPFSDNIVVILSSGSSKIPYTKIYRGSLAQNNAMSAYTLPTNTWFHLATVYDGQNLMMYVNGSLVANSTSAGPLSVNRTNCYIGRSNWYSYGTDPDASACFDDMMLFNRALNPNEVQYYMSYNFH